MAFDRIVKSATNAARTMVLAPLLFGTLALTAPAPAQAADTQTCSVVLFVEVCTGGAAAPAPAPMLGGSLLSLVSIGGFVVLRRRMAAEVRDTDPPAIDD